MRALLGALIKTTESTINPFSTAVELRFNNVPSAIKIMGNTIGTKAKCKGGKRIFSIVFTPPDLILASLCLGFLK
jgi:hypothetical protein|tara:strand:+ start:210 stop:434 length:225 start_codon:yes stop_codon:yes gene_type:complete